MRRERPLLAILPGDPGGIGPELLAKLLADPAVTGRADMVVIGDRHIIARGERDAGVELPLSTVETPAALDDGRIAYVETDTIDERDVKLAEATAAGGKSCIALLTRCLDLARDGAIDGFMFCPMNKAALHAAGLGAEDEMQWIKRHLGYEGDVGEINALEGLWTSRVTSHVPIRHVADRITRDEVVRAVRLLTEVLRKSGLQRPRISVCGLNPHAGDGGNIGREEIETIQPAVAEANAQGYPCDGPWPADTIFVRARKGGTDGIVTMYHDQGQIAMKLMGFERGVTILGGLPVSITTPAHGTAYDIAGKGIADPQATRAAFETLLAMTGTAAMAA